MLLLGAVPHRLPASRRLIFVMKSFAGFTLLELMITLTVASILLMVGVPSFQEFGRRHTLTAATNDLVADLHLARSEALKRRAVVTLCKSATLQNCTTSGGWEQGWMLFSDADTLGNVDKNDLILRTHVPATGGNATIRGDAAFRDRLSFQGSGLLVQNAGTFILCNSSVKTFTTDKGKARAVTVSKAGRIRSVKGDDETLIISSCTPN